MNLTPRLITAFGVVVILLIAVLGVGIVSANKQSDVAATPAFQGNFHKTTALARYQSANFYDWQTTSAFDALRGQRARPKIPETQERHV